MGNRYNTEDIEELIKEVKELRAALANITRPPEYIIYDDVQLREFLKVSKRTTAYWREKGLIVFSKLGGKLYYKLSDILSLLKEHEVTAVTSNLKIAL